MMMMMMVVKYCHTNRDGTLYSNDFGNFHYIKEDDDDEEDLTVNHWRDERMPAYGPTLGRQLLQTILD